MYLQLNVILIIISLYFINASPLGNINLTHNSDNNGKTNLFVSQFPDSGRKQAILEQETPFSKVDTTYSRVQEFVANLYNPKPIIDSITEDEKYGNDGDKFRSIGTAVVGGIEGFSNFLNAAVEFPIEKAKQIGKQITASLNKVGGKLVGLR